MFHTHTIFNYYLWCLFPYDLLPYNLIQQTELVIRSKWSLLDPLVELTDWKVTWFTSMPVWMTFSQAFIIENFFFKLQTSSLAVDPYPIHKIMECNIIPVKLVILQVLLNLVTQSNAHHPRKNWEPRSILSGALLAT